MDPDSGFESVDVPRRLKSWADKFSSERLTVIVTQLENGKWLSDPKELCDTRSSAYYRAESLIAKLVIRSEYESYMFQRRTWPENGGHRWAIRLRKE